MDLTKRELDLLILTAEEFDSTGRLSKLIEVGE